MRVFCWIVLVLLILALSPPATGQTLVEPPFVRQWTALVGENATVIAVRVGVIFYYSKEGVGALDLTTGQRKWSSLAHIVIPAAKLKDQTIYAIAQGEKNSTLEAIDIATGQARTLVSLPVRGRLLACDYKRIYILDDLGQLWAYHPTSGAVLWSRQLGTPRSGGIEPVQLTLGLDCLYVALNVFGEFGVARADGAILWNHDLQLQSFGRSRLYPPIVLGNDVLLQNDGLRRVAMRTGDLVWKEPLGDGDLVFCMNVLIGRYGKKLLGRDSENGRVLWELPLHDPDVSRPLPKGVDPKRLSLLPSLQEDDSYRKTQEYVAFIDGDHIWIGLNPVRCVSMVGKVSWSRAHPFTGTPCYVNRLNIVTIDGDRILGYTAGKLPPLPKTEPERRALAQRLASQCEILDDAECKQLERLTPYAFPLLLARYVACVRAVDADTGERKGVGLLFSLRGLSSLLLATCRNADTVSVVKAWSSLGEKSSGRETLRRLLIAKGNPADIPPRVKSLLHPPAPAHRSGSITP